GRVEAIWKHRLVPGHSAVDRLGVGVEQQLARVAAMATLRRPGPEDPVAVALAWPDVRRVSVPALSRALGQQAAADRALLVEEPQLDALGHRREEREVGACPVVAGAQRKRLTRPELHCARLSSSFRAAQLGSDFAQPWRGAAAYGAWAAIGGCVCVLQSACENSMQFHLVSFEGPDAYARAGGLATRVEGLASALVAHGFDVHLWFIGDPCAPAVETVRGLHLHRWCQWLSRHHPLGVYQGEEPKRLDFATSLPPWLLEAMAPHLRDGGHAGGVAEEWETADVVLHLDWLLRRAALRDRVTVLWNANNGFGFDRVDWPRLSQAAVLTTVSRYMKHAMRPLGVNPIVIPNGLGPEAFGFPERAAVRELHRRLRGRTGLVKIARFDPSKRWLDALGAAAEMKRLGWRPLLLARGGAEAHGCDVRRAAAEAGLRLATRTLREPGERGVLDALADIEGVDVVEILSHLDPPACKLLLRGAAVVLANSAHEPFGLVGLEAMA